MGFSGEGLKCLWVFGLEAPRDSHEHGNSVGSCNLPTHSASTLCVFLSPDFPQEATIPIYIATKNEI